MTIQNFLGAVMAFAVGFGIATATRAAILLNTDYECTMERHIDSFTVSRRELERERAMIFMTTHDGRTVGLRRDAVQECKKL